MFVGGTEFNKEIEGFIECSLGIAVESVRFVDDYDGVQAET